MFPRCENVCFSLHIDKTVVCDIFSDSLLNTDTRIIRTLWHDLLVSVLTGRPQVKQTISPSF